MSHRLPSGQSNGDILHIEVPPSQMTLACGKLTETNQHKYPLQAPLPPVPGCLCIMIPLPVPQPFLSLHAAFVAHLLYLAGLECSRTHVIHSLPFHGAISTYYLYLANHRFTPINLCQKKIVHYHH